MRSDLRGKFAIVGVGEPDVINRVPDKTEMEMGVEALVKAANDAGINVKDIDGLFTNGPSPNQLCEYIGVIPTHADSGGIGAVSAIAQVGHAISAINSGACTVAAIILAESSRSEVGVAKPGRGDSSATTGGQHLTPYGLSGAFSEQAKVANLYNHTYGTSMTGFAELAVSTRKWAQLHPRAAFKDAMTVEDVLNSRMISYPLTLLMNCPRTDSAAAIIVTSAERARDLRKDPVYVLGAAHAIGPGLPWKEDLLSWEMVRQSGKDAFAMAGVRHSEIDVAQTHDCFIPVPVIELESLGFCGKGEGLDFVSHGRTAPGGQFPMNTNGGGLSYTHSGGFGLASICDTVEQLRGESGPRQISKARIGLVQGSGGGFSLGTTLILTSNRP